MHEKIKYKVKNIRNYIRRSLVKLVKHETKFRFKFVNHKTQGLALDERAEHKLKKHLRNKSLQKMSSLLTKVNFLKPPDH